MFFTNQSFSPEILSVLSIERESSNAQSDHRPYHALAMYIGDYARLCSDDVELNLESGDIIFIPADKIYSMRSGREHLLVVHFSSDICPSEKIEKFVSRDAAYFEDKLTELYTAWNKRSPGYEFECRAIFNTILYRIERECAEQVRSDTKDKIIEAEEYIREHFTDRELNIDDMAKMYGMSDTYFRKLFMERFGTTPLKYINNLRLGYAKELLESKYYTVGEVSDMCGFNNINYFSTFIKKEMGISPKKL